MFPFWKWITKQKGKSSGKSHTKWWKLYTTGWQKMHTGIKKNDKQKIIDISTKKYSFFHVWNLKNILHYVSENSCILSPNTFDHISQTQNK